MVLWVGQLLCFVRSRLLFPSRNHFCIDFTRRNRFAASQRAARRSFAAVSMLFACWSLHLLRVLLIRGFYDRHLQASRIFSLASCPQLYFWGGVRRSCGMLFILSVPCLGRKGWLGLFLLGEADISRAEALHTWVSVTPVSSRAGISSQKLKKKKKIPSAPMSSCFSGGGKFVRLLCKQITWLSPQLFLIPGKDWLATTVGGLPLFQNSHHS